jgi:hypothetical protein
MPPRRHTNGCRTQTTKLDEAESDTSEYQKRLGSLMYAMLGTHPELAHPIAILRQCQVQLNPTILNTDHQASISLARNPVFHKATKHIEVRYHHMWYCFESGAIVPTYILTDNQVTNILTKLLARDKQQRFSHAMGLVWNRTLSSE